MSNEFSDQLFFGLAAIFFLLILVLAALGTLKFVIGFLEDLKPIIIKGAIIVGVIFCLFVAYNPKAASEWVNKVFRPQPEYQDPFVNEGGPRLIY